MQRKMIFRDTGTNEEWVMPVTPAGYEIEHGRQIIGMTMQAVGSVNLPGPAVLLDQELEFLLPARDYPFNQPGTNLNPFVYLERLEKWSDAGTVLRFIVSDTPVNAAVLLGPIRYREKDGTNDIYCTVPIKGYRSLTAETVEDAATGNAARPIEAEPTHQGTYTVVMGDTLSGICRRFYGDASLYGRLAAANGIKNVNLIHPGQVLTLPDVGQLPQSAVRDNGAIAKGTSKSGKAKLTVHFGGNRGCYGTCEVNAPNEVLTLSTRITDGSVVLPVGTNVELIWHNTATNGISAEFINVNGKNVSVKYNLYEFKLAKDTEVYIYWRVGAK